MYDLQGTLLTPYSIVSLFLVVTPGLEDLAKQELYEKIDLFFPDCEVPEMELLTGGIEVKWELLKAVQLNTILKIPTRILLRVDSFKCRDFPKLFKRIQRYPWKDVLFGPQFKLSVSSKSSRLIHTKRIEDSVNDGILKYFKAFPPKKNVLEKMQETPIQSIYIRFNQDICTISLDTSGEALYRRGLKLFTTEAPIRETIASALLYNLHRYIENDRYTLIDPMCGSGTHLLESSHFYESNHHRQYQFYYWPKFPEFESAKINSHFLPKIFIKYFGFDQDRDTIEVAKKNLKQYNSKNILFKQKDLFISEPLKDGQNVILINPPYGKRIAPYQQLEDFYHALFEKCYEQYEPELFGMVVPNSFSYRRIIIKNYRLLEKRDFSNGGIKVHFLLFKKVQKTDNSKSK